MTDLILRGGRVIDPASGRDETADIAFGDGKVTEIGATSPPAAPRLSICAGCSSCLGPSLILVLGRRQLPNPAA